MAKSGHYYHFVDAALNWTESLAACEDRHGALAMAYNADRFEALREVYDHYRASVGSAAGAWLDGRRANATSSWRCEDDKIDCASAMPWSTGEPNRPDSEHCVLLWYSRTDGVANYDCNRMMPAICEVT